MNVDDARSGMVGLGPKHSHWPSLMALDPRQVVDGSHFFVEVHAENYLVEGGPRLRQLQQARDRWPLSIHGVGLSIGGIDAPDDAHLRRLKALLDRFEPQWFSEHLAWSSHEGHWFNDLLPIAYNAHTLHRVCCHIDHIQERLRRPILLENPSTYLSFSDTTMDEGRFMAAVARRTGCKILLDLNNAYINGINHHHDPWALVLALPTDAIAEIHLAGFAQDPALADVPWLIDTHGAPVSRAVWSLYERTIARIGPRPTLIERDNEVPSLDTLRTEARLAAQMMCRAHRPAHDCVTAPSL